MLSSEINATVEQATDIKLEHVRICVLCGAVRLPGEQVHVVGHTGKALGLPDNVVLLLLPFLQLCVHI